MTVATATTSYSHSAMLERTYALFKSFDLLGNEHEQNSFMVLESLFLSVLQTPHSPLL